MSLRSELMSGTAVGELRNERVAHLRAVAAKVPGGIREAFLYGASGNIVAIDLSLPDYQIQALLKENGIDQ